MIPSDSRATQASVAIANRNWSARFFTFARDCPAPKLFGQGSESPVDGPLESEKPGLPEVVPALEPLPAPGAVPGVGVLEPGPEVEGLGEDGVGLEELAWRVSADDLSVGSEELVRK